MPPNTNRHRQERKRLSTTLGRTRVKADAYKQPTGGYTMVIRSATPPGDALYHLDIAAATLTETERRELAWGAKQGWFDAQQAEAVIKRAIDALEPAKAES